MGVMCTEEEEADWYTKQELFSRSILVPVVDLLPHVQIIVSASVELKRNTPHPVEHEEGAKHVADICESP